MDFDRLATNEALITARRAAHVALVPRAAIAELAGLTLHGLRRAGAALEIPAGTQPTKGPRKAGRRRVSGRACSGTRNPATTSTKRAAAARLDTSASRCRQGDEPRGSQLLAEPAQAPIDRLAVGRAMERFIASRIAAYEAADRDDPEPEKTARTIGHYARALGLVRGYLSDIEKDEETHGEAPERSLSDLRDELRRHLERIWDESRAAGSLGDNPTDAP